MFIRLVSKQQVEICCWLLSRKIFTQRLSLDFELATGAARMVDFICQLQVADGIFVFDLLSLVSSAACSLIRVLLSVLPSLLSV